MEILKIKFLILCLLHFLCVLVSGKLRSFNIGNGEKPSSSQMGEIYLRVYSACTMAIPFEFGTPAQHFNLSFDFFMPDTTLYLQNIPYKKVSDADPPMYTRNIFSPNTSSTFKNHSTTNFSDFFYGQGYLAEDYVNNPLIWKEQKSRMDFMLITKAGIPGMVLPYLPIDGFLGMAPHRMTSFGIPSFMYWLTQKSGDNSSSITFYLNKFNSNDPDDTKQSSYAVVDFLGGGLPSFCDASEWFYSTVARPDWSLMAKRITMESKSAGGNSSTIILSENQVTIIVPTSFSTQIPAKQMDALSAIIGAKERDFPGVYQLDCNSTKTAPTVKFFFANSNGDQLLIKFEPNEYIIPSEFDDCQLIFTKNPNPKDVNIYLLGYSFFQKHCFQLKYNIHSSH